MTNREKLNKMNNKELANLINSQPWGIFTKIEDWLNEEATEYKRLESSDLFMEV